ncbi:DUF4230 domain-containing protein [Coprococcus catus]|uniref:DUF4230 domain-containing protein n=1 Tax=Coprococcus catus TaxID=116085 RepID=A0A3E2XPK3_9FIRM|nr:DUF4230 domain-containing protein [Coprococcus catus]RGC50456.1 DUF4230 domain-containing protein [Coprococcus catus]
MSTEKKIKKLKMIGISMIVGILIGALIGILIYKKVDNVMNKKEVTLDYLTGKLENIGEFATQEVTYTSRVQIEKGSIPFITQKGFTMEYNATLKAGVEIENLKIDKKGAKYIISLPHADFLDTAHIDPNSIKFIDEKKAVLNWNNKDDVAEAIAKAEKDVMENPTVDKEMLFERADENVERLIHVFLDDLVGEDNIEIDFK